MTDSVSVEQCDRDAVADHLAKQPLSNTLLRLRIREGDEDSHPLVQAFARHRIEAQRRSSEREEKLRALVEEAFLEGYSLGGTPRDAGRSWELSDSRQALEATNG